MSFSQVALFQLPDVTLVITVFAKRSMKRKDLIGWFSLGYNCTGEEEQTHWLQMRDAKTEETAETKPKPIQICRWHSLLLG